VRQLEIKVLDIVGEVTSAQRSAVPSWSCSKAVYKPV